MTEASASEVQRPKKHSPFVQVVFRKAGETLDLAGKVLVGFSGVGTVLKGDVVHANWPVLLAVMVGGGVTIGVGIYLQAKAEETST